MTTSTLHVIFGTGPVGCWIARALRADGHPVRAVNRSGRRPSLMPDDVEVVAADVSDASQARAAAAGAAVVYQALGPPYHQWAQLFPALQAGAIEAARAAGARYVSIENLYMYDPSTPMSEDSRIAPPSGKGELRRRLAEEVQALHASGTLRTATLRASDYYGPGVRESSLGERVFGRLVAGQAAQVLGSAALPHSFAYIEDVGRAAALVGTRDEALGQVWFAPHAPPLTQRQMVEAACRALGMPTRLQVVSPLMLRLAGLFDPAARASVEMLYEFTAPFVVASDRFERRFGLPATPTEVGIERTVAWYRTQPARREA
ncbi:MAG: NAD(P)H-binding protein [Steroidobacteraceae bacterium]